MLGWLRGGAADVNKENRPPQNSANDEHSHAVPIDYTNAPDTPAAAFALKAFRTAVFGTPHPSHTAPPPLKQTGANTTNASKTNTVLFAEKDINASTKPKPSDLTAAKDIDRFPSRKEILKERATGTNSNAPDPTLRDEIGDSTTTGRPVTHRDDNSSDDDGDELYRTPMKRTTKHPPGILVTPGFTNTKKKAVSFAASTSDEVKPRPQPRIRSGLPHEFPGKFPSPWTPRTGTPNVLDARAETVKKTLFETSDHDPKMDPAKKAKMEAAASMLKQNDDLIANLKEESKPIASAPTAVPIPTVQLENNDVTVNLDFPKSESGKYWKERVEEVEEQYEKTLRKAEKWQEVSKAAKTYAKKKDAQCAEMAERLREAIKENQRLFEDVEELKASKAMMIHTLNSKGIAVRSGGDDNKDIAELRATIAAYEKKVEVLEALLGEKEEDVQQLSMYIEESPDADTDDVISGLKRQLRKAKHELREMTLVKVDNDSKKLRLVTIEKELEDYKKEKLRLEDELREARGMGDTTHIASKNRSLHENRLRLQVERLEQDKINLMAEMRDKIFKEANERREMEKKYKHEIRTLESKLDAANLATEKKLMEANELSRKLADMERQLARRAKELEDALHQVDELKKNVNALAPVTPRSSSESALWQAKQRTTMQELRQVKEEVSNLRMQLEDKDMELQNKSEELIKLRFKLHANGATNSVPEVAVRSMEAFISSPIPNRTSIVSTFFTEKETDTSDNQMKDYEDDNAADAEKSVTSTLPDPFKPRTRLSRTPLNASPARNGARTPSPTRKSQKDMTPSRFLNRTPRPSNKTAATVTAAGSPTPRQRSPSPSRYVTRSPAKDIRKDLFSASRPAFSNPGTEEDKMEETSLSPNRKLEDDFNSTITASTAVAVAPPVRPSPRASYIPFDLSPDASIIPRFTSNTTARQREIRKRQSLGNESTFTHATTTAANRRHSGGSRRVSSGGLGKDTSILGGLNTVGTGRVTKKTSTMDPARRAAAEARIAERRARKSDGASGGVAV